MTDSPDVPLRPVSLKKVIALKRLILDDVCFSYYGSVLEGETFREFVSRLLRGAVLKVGHGTVLASLLDVAGREFSPDLAEDVAWRLAGNYWQRLRKGVPVPPWSGRAEREWSYVVVERVVASSRVRVAKDARQAMAADRRGLVHSSGSSVTLRFLTGLPAGRRVVKFVSSDALHVVKAAFGFSKFDPSQYSRSVTGREYFPLSDPRELYGMRALALIDPAACRADHVAYSDVRGTSSTLAWNKTLMRRRERTEHACPMNYPTDQVACHECMVGRDKCLAACHAKSFRVDRCEVCGRENAVLDPEDGPVDKCVDCAAKLQ